MSETPSTPGSLAVENLKANDAAMVEFKKPVKGSVKKGKPKILSEERYIEEMAKIIQRDFFPDLDKLRAQNEYLDAMERNDIVLMQALRAKYSTGGCLPTQRAASMTPATFETPVQAANSAIVTDTPKSTASFDSTATRSTTSGSVKSLADQHSLDSFLQSYTSEDNYSFQEIIDTADEKLRQKFAVLYKEETLSAEQLARALTLPTIEQQFEQPDPMRKIETWSYTNKNSIMYIPDGVELTSKEQIENADRKQIIQHGATRISAQLFDESKKPTDAARSQAHALTNNKIGVDGNLLNQNKSLAAPIIRGYELVSTPTPSREDFSPMTWGEIEGTPFLLDGSDTPVRSNAGPSFKINENSRREAIALSLAEKVGEKMRAQKQRNMNTARKNIGSPYMRSSMDRLASMSPAARRLATTKLGIGLRTPIMTTPSPLRTPVLRSAKQKMPRAGWSASQKTPSITPVNSAPNTPKQISITDDLLTIRNKRLNAADFF